MAIKVIWWQCTDLQFCGPEPDISLCCETTDKTTINLCCNKKSKNVEMLYTC